MSVASTVEPAGSSILGTIRLLVTARCDGCSLVAVLQPSKACYTNGVAELQWLQLSQPPSFSILLKQLLLDAVADFVGRSF